MKPVKKVLTAAVKKFPKYSNCDDELMALNKVFSVGFLDYKEFRRLKRPIFVCHFVLPTLCGMELRYYFIIFLP